MTSSPGRGKSFLKGRALGIAGGFLAWVQSCLPGSYPFRLLPLVAATFPKGTAFGGSDKVSGIAQRRPLGGAGERSEPEGVSAETPPVAFGDSPLWDGAFGIVGKLSGKLQSLRFRQWLSLWESWRVAPERARTLAGGTPEAPSPRELAKPSGFD